jgi:hypothetical protein
LIDFPGAAGGTFLQGINDHSTIVGWYFPSSSSVTHGLILDQQGFHSFDFPGSTSTQLSGINVEGDVVGNYTDSNSVVHGFLAAPMPEAQIPEPASPLLVTSGLAAILVLLIRRKRIAKISVH